MCEDEQEKNFQGVESWPNQNSRGFGTHIYSLGFQDGFWLCDCYVPAILSLSKCVVYCSHVVPVPSLHLGSLQIKRSNIQTWYRNYHVSPRVHALWVCCHDWGNFSFFSLGDGVYFVCEEEWSKYWWLVGQDRLCSLLFWRNCIWFASFLQDRIF